MSPEQNPKGEGVTYPSRTPNAKRRTHGVRRSEVTTVLMGLWRVVREWAWVELNYRPHAYQTCALTT